MNSKGQGALEYLLLIGGAVLIAVIVIAVITGVANTSGTGANDAAMCSSQLSCTKCLVQVSKCNGVDGSGTMLTGWASGFDCTTTVGKTWAMCKIK